MGRGCTHITPARLYRRLLLASLSAELSGRPAIASSQAPKAVKKCSPPLISLGLHFGAQWIAEYKPEFCTRP
eukprot:scaffold175583_cov21-Tisochrysis_lutea.AAC.2